MDQDHDPNGVGDVQEPDLAELDQVRDDLDTRPGNDADLDVRVDDPEPRPIVDDDRDADGPGRGRDDDRPDDGPDGRDRPDGGRPAPGPEPVEPRPRPIVDGGPAPVPVPEPAAPAPAPAPGGDPDPGTEADGPHPATPAPLAAEPQAEIRLDGPDDPAIAAPLDAEPTAADDGEIRLDTDVLDADGADLGDEATSDELDDQQPEDLFPLPGDDASGSETFMPAPDNGWLTPALLAAAAGAAVATALSAPLARFGDRLTSRLAAVSLEEHGIEARVEHGTLDRLETWLTSTGDEVMVSVHSAGRAPQVCSIVSIDRASGVMVVEEPGPLGMRLDVRLDEFERSWADTANEVLVTEGSGRQVRLLPVTLGDRSLVAPGW